MIKKIGIFLVLIVSSLFLGCVEPSNDIEIVNEPSVTIVPISEQNVAKYDFEWYTTDHIGEYHTAPYGYTYAVVTYKIQNNGHYTIDISPLYWTFTVNGISYDYCSESYDDSINTMSAKISPGSSFTNKIAFIIHDGGSRGALKYESPWYNDEIKLLLDNSLIKDTIYITYEDLEQINIESDELNNISLDDIDPNDFEAYHLYNELKDRKKLLDILSLPLNDETFLQWFDYQKKGYGKCDINSKEIREESLIQLEKFELKNEDYIELRNKFRDYLEHANSMDDREIGLLCSDRTTAAESRLHNLWKGCENSRRYI